MASPARDCTRFCGIGGLPRNRGSYCLAVAAGGAVAPSLRRAHVPVCMGMGPCPGKAQHGVCGLSPYPPFFRSFSVHCTPSEVPCERFRLPFMENRPAVATIHSHLFYRPLPIMFHTLHGSQWLKADLARKVKNAVFGEAKRGSSQDKLLPCMHAQSESRLALPWRLTIMGTVLQPGSEASASSLPPWNKASKKQAEMGHSQKGPRKRFGPYDTGQHESRPTAPIPTEHIPPASRHSTRREQQSRA